MTISFYNEIKKQIATPNPDMGTIIFYLLYTIIFQIILNDNEGHDNMYRQIQNDSTKKPEMKHRE